MLDRAACERRVYRLATLLTGNPIAATKVIAQVIDAQPDLRKLDSAHMDRLTVLRSREIRPSALADNRVPRTLADALLGLSAQQREAWIFTHVYRATDREIAKAMDCSVTAAHRHLEHADLLMRQRLGAAMGDAPSALLAYSMSLDVPEFYRAQQKRRRQWRIAVLIIAAAIVLLLATGTILWLRH